MTYILDNDVSNLIDDDAQWRDEAGTLHPGNEPKSSFASLVKVSETAPPDETLNIVTGSHVELIDGIPTRVWDYRPKTAQELKAQHNAPILSELSSLDAYIPRGLEDFWAIVAFATASLPEQERTRLARKIELRGQLQ